MSPITSSCGNAAAISSSEGAAWPVAGGSSASRNRHAGQNPLGAWDGMGAWQVGQIFGFTQVPDGCDRRGYKIVFSDGEGTGCLVNLDGNEYEI